MIEGTLLRAFCFIRLGAGESPLPQMALALPVGTVFPAAYAIGLVLDRRPRE